MKNLKRPSTPVIAVSKGGEIKEAEKKIIILKASVKKTNKF